MDDSDKIYDNEPIKKASSTDLKEAENSYSSESSVDNESDKLGKGYVASGKAGRSNFISKLKSAGKKKWLVGGLLGSGLGVVVLLIVLLMIASSLKIPNLAQHITSYEFARITRQFSENAQRVTSEKLVLSSTLDANSKLSFADQVKAKYPGLAKASDTLDKLNSYRPENVIKTLGQDNNLRLNFTNNKFTGSTLDGNTFNMKSAGKITGKVPLLRDVIDFKGQLQFSRDFAPALDSAMKLSDVGPIIRGATARQVRQRLGIGLIAWNLGKFQGKTAEEARLVQEREKVTKINSGAKPAINSSVEEISKTSEAVVKEEARVLADDTLLKDVIAKNGVSTTIQATIESGVGSSIFKTALGIGSPFYAIALPICIVYDGSITNSDTTINNNTQKQQAAFYYIASAADKQKEGSNNNADSGALTAAVGATNLDLGDISNSVPEVRASGGNIDSVGVGISSEASASGQYSLLNVFLGNGPFTGFANAIIQPACKNLTDIKLALAFTAVNIVANIASFGGASIPEAAAVEGSTVIVKSVTQTMTEKFVSKIAAKATGTVADKEFTFAASRGGRLFNLIYGNAKSIAKVVGATVMAKLLVMQQSGLLVNGFAQGEELANMAASGGNIQAGELSRQQMFGRPLTSAEVAQSDQADSQYVAYQNQSRSFTDRYFATSNADSLISHMAMGVSASFHTGFIASVIKIASSVFRPFSYIGSFIGIVNHKVLAATTDTSNLHFGNVQFGWSQAEENLINNDASYQPLENQVILDASVDANGVPTKFKIAHDYAQCFGYTSDDSGNLTPISLNSGQGTLGDLFAKSMIVRDNDGNVVAGDGLCSPNNLGQNMVMRWRLAMSYNTTLDQLTGLQNVTN